MGGRFLSKSLIAVLTLVICAAVGLGAATAYASETTGASNGGIFRTDTGNQGRFANFSIALPLAQSLDGAVVTVSPDSYVFTTKSITPDSVTVTLDGVTLVAGTDYTLSYEDNKDVGTATVIVTGAGDYAGSETSATFTITQADIADCTIGNFSDAKATGEPIEPTVTISDDRYASLGKQGAVLKQDTDYTLTYKNNVEVGTATVTISGMGNYTGSVEKTFEITPYLVIYKQEGEDVEPEAVATYNQKEFETLAEDDRTPVSAMFWQDDSGGWKVASSNWYVTLDELFESLDVAWGEGSTLSYGGDDSSGKGGQSYTFEEITDQGWFFPDASGHDSNNPEDKVEAPAILTVREYSQMSGTSEAETAQDAENYNIEHRSDANEPRILYGISEEGYADPATDWETTRGLRYWSRCSYLTVTEPENPFSDAVVTVEEGD